MNDVSEPEAEHSLPTDLDALFTLAEAYGRATGLAEGTVSWRVLGGGNRLRDLRSGKDIGARRLAEALRWFAKHWPETAPWPASVLRPEEAS